MDSLVREGVLVCKWAYDVHNKLVRDNIVNILEAEGYECQYHIVSQKKQKKVLIDKLREEVCEFTEEPSIEELADVLEVIDAIKEKFGYDDVELSLAKEQKKEHNGAFDKMLFLEKAVINNG
jgi:predicted house-cleaning noncanonical NTP pyrophosphatase (MazG superfamily)